MSNARGDASWMRALAEAFCLELAEKSEAGAQACVTQLRAVAAIVSAIRDPEPLTHLQEAWQQTLDPCVLHLLSILAERGRVADCGELLQAVEDWRERHGFHRVALSAAQTLSDDQKQAILQRLKSILGGSITLEERIDPNLLGGFTLEARGWSYDASLRHRLGQLSQTLVRAKL